MLRTLKTALTFGFGALIGWLLLGWVLFPVQWTNANLEDLSPSAKATYLLLVADSYALDGDVAKARALVAPLDQEEAAELVAALIADRRARGALTEAGRLESLASALQLRPTADPSVMGPEQPGVDALAQPEPEPGSAPPPIADQALSELDELRVDGTKLAVACGAGTGVLFFLVLLAGLAVVRRRSRSSSQPKRAETPYYAPPPSRGPTPAGKSKRHFGTTYNLGDDGYDASFTLEGPEGEFLGECGVSQAEVLDAGVPAKIGAFEVWLFDHREVRTVTKVLVSPHAYHDSGLRQKLAAKGEAVLAEVGRVVVLETGSLRCEAEITQVQFAEHDGARNAYFTRLSVDLAVG